VAIKTGRETRDSDGRRRRDWGRSYTGQDFPSLKLLAPCLSDVAAVGMEPCPNGAPRRPLRADTPDAGASRAQLRGTSSDGGRMASVASAGGRAETCFIKQQRCQARYARFRRAADEAAHSASGPKDSPQACPFAVWDWSALQPLSIRCTTYLSGN
jgi:hypothetical protein